MSMINKVNISLGSYVATLAKFAVPLRNFARYLENFSGMKMRLALNELPVPIFPMPTTEPVKVRVINHMNETKPQRNHYG
ncbi:hypothetical protein [Lentilitoribacter sp. Alg239-R112]|uniref:hypothetical protein n=1 Tax=Lentilitoribacter sp. Alg239-R112 TaxID=2305987 RepID=UPI0013A6FC3D|nr:hypothetical protein [Lentilitoribacter sp. Alg239-R112]